MRRFSDSRTRMPPGIRKRQAKKSRVYNPSSSHSAAFITVHLSTVRTFTLRVIASSRPRPQRTASRPHLTASGCRSLEPPSHQNFRVVRKLPGHENLIGTSWSLSSGLLYCAVLCTVRHLGSHPNWQRIEADHRAVHHPCTAYVIPLYVSCFLVLHADRFSSECNLATSSMSRDSQGTISWPTTIAQRRLHKIRLIYIRTTNEPRPFI